MSQNALPRDLIELQLAQIDLLMAMYPGEGAVSMDEATSESLDNLRTWQNGTPEATSPNTGSSISLFLTLDLGIEGGIPERILKIEILVPFADDEDTRRDLDEPPRPKVRLVQPSWMTRAETTALIAKLPENDDLIQSIEHIKEVANSSISSMPKTPAEVENDKEDAEMIVRVWFYFPSISTRSKRDDIVNYASAYSLTGFLLSGKPGVLCLEGTSDKVDAYMKFIKTESWGDIPAYQKKVSERFREPGVARAFIDMREITDTLGERRGERANRGDMKLLEAWLVERGLGSAFMKVLT